MAAPGITLDELLAEYRRLGIDAHQDSDGLTSREWAAKWQICQKTAVDIIRKFSQAGWVKPGQKTVVTIRGNESRVPCYQISKPRAAKRGKK